MSRSHAQLRATFVEYAKISKHDIEAAIKKEMSGDLKTGMLTVGKLMEYYEIGNGSLPSIRILSHRFTMRNTFPYLKLHF